MRRESCVWTASRIRHCAYQLLANIKDSGLLSVIGSGGGTRYQLYPKRPQILEFSLLGAQPGYVSLSH